MKILIDVPKETVNQLQALAKRRRTSRAEVVRQAVARYVEMNQVAVEEDLVFGMWKGKRQDSLAIEDKIRSEWGAHERRS
jgi:predicted DNA-binding protein